MCHFSLMYSTDMKGVETEAESVSQFTWVYRAKVEHIKDWVEEVSSRAILLTKAFFLIKRLWMLETDTPVLILVYGSTTILFVDLDKLHKPLSLISYNSRMWNLLWRVFMWIKSDHRVCWAQYWLSVNFEVLSPSGSKICMWLQLFHV